MERASRRGSVALGWLLHAAALGAAGAAIRIDRRCRRRFPSGLPGIGSPGVATAAVTSWAALGLLEARRPFRHEWNRPNQDDLRVDVAFFVSSFPVGVVTEAVATAVARRTTRRLPLAALPTPVAVGALVLVYDLFHSQYHRVCHVWGPGWRLHSIHHSPRRLYWFNASRFHAVESLIDLTVERTLVSLTDLTPDQKVAYEAFRAVYGQLRHCNVDLRSGLLDHVFSTPDLHRWHHSTDYDEGDTNYGAVTSLWDRLFGTWFRPERSFDGEVGVGRMPEFPTTFAALEAAPFRWRAIRSANAATFGSGR